MTLTPEQQNVCSTIWGVHVGGNSSLAAQSAMDELAKIDHENFSDLEVHDFFCQIARIAAVTSSSAAKRSRSIQSATKYAQQSLLLMLDAYPLAETIEDAQIRAKYWKGVYGEESSLFICLRDVLHVLQFVSQYILSHEVSEYMRKVHQLLRDIPVSSAPEQSERFHLIYLIEEAPFEEALIAFRKYHALHGPTEAERHTKEQYETVLWRIIERCLKDQRNDAKEELLTLIPNGQLQFGNVQAALRKKNLQRYVFAVQSVFAPGKWKKVRTVVTEMLRRTYIGEFSFNES